MQKIKKLIIIIILLIMPGLLYPQSIVIKNDNGSEMNLYDKSYALVIGISHYSNGWPTLDGVMKDVSDIKQILEKQGFTVVTVIDPNHNELENAYKDFINQYGLNPENRLILYFAGHGHTIKTTYGEEMGYIVPSDAPNPNSDRNDFLAKAMAMQQIEVFAKQIQSKHALFLFDACFSGSIFAISRAIPENISYKTAKPVRQFITSGSAEETVPDESIFKNQFVDGINGEADLNNDGYVTGTELGEFLQEKVVNYSKGSQHPQYGKIRNPNLDKGDFVFISSANKENITLKSKADNSGTVVNHYSENEIKRNENITGKNIHRYQIIKDEGYESSIVDMPELFAKVAFRTANGFFVTSEQGGGKEVTSIRKNINQYETFKIISLGDNKVAFKTHKGYYLSISDKDSTLGASADVLGDKTTFEIIALEGDNVAIKTYDGHFLCALSGGGRQIVPSKQVKEHEIFKMFLVRNYRIKTSNGLFASIDEEKISAISQKPDDAQELEFVKVDRDKIAIRDSKGKFLRITSKESYVDSKEITDECVFIPEVLSNGLLRLKTLGGKYVTAIGGGGFMFRADKQSAGDWETFELFPTTPFNK